MHHSFAPLLPIASRNNFRWLPSEVVSEAFELPDDVITQQKSTQALRNSAFRQAALCCVSLSGCESIMNSTCIRSGRQVKVSGAGRGGNNCVKKNSHGPSRFLHQFLRIVYSKFQRLDCWSYDFVIVPSSPPSSGQLCKFFSVLSSFSHFYPPRALMCSRVRRSWWFLAPSSGALK